MNLCLKCGSCVGQRPTVENHIPPSEAAQIHESISTLAQAVISQGSDNRTALEVIDESNQSIQALEAQLSDIKLLLVNQPSEQEKKIRLTFDQDFKPPWENGPAIKSPVTVYLGNAPKLHIQPTDKLNRTRMRPRYHPPIPARHRTRLPLRAIRLARLHRRYRILRRLRQPRRN
jgi:hypothetical protein